ncbi:MAG: dipeptide epimerase [Ginsengibacter sp.]
MEEIKITSVEVYKLLLPLKEPFIISLGPILRVENIIIKINTNNDISGIGECSPYLTINGESIDTCFIVARYFSKALKGNNPLNISYCHKIMDSCIYGNSSIKSAFDMALYDIAAKSASVPLYKFLSGKEDKKIITDITVSIGPPEKMAANSLKYIKEGFQIIKVKLGGTKEEDIERIKSIREASGWGISLRIDANQGWDNSEVAIDVLKALERFNIEFCEEPIARWRFMELEKVKRHSPIPIMADETCCDHHDAERLIKLGACDMINIKLGKCSGIFNALKIAQLCEDGNMVAQVGGFMESKIGMTAAAHFATCSENIKYFDFDTPLMFLEDPSIGGIEYMNNGKIKLPETPGLGVEIDAAFFQNCEKAIY